MEKTLKVEWYDVSRHCEAAVKKALEAMTAYPLQRQIT